MKIALIFIFLIFNTAASAADYYISSSGNDTNNGLSTSTPWKTIAKVNSTFPIMKPGDNILFNRGDTFYGSLTITKSGASGSPITIGAYGTGEKPIITGFTTITGWTNEGGGIYSKVISSEAQTNMVTIDGVQYGMGRYPNTGYLTYQSFSTNTSITSSVLNSAGTNWTGAEVVIRKNDWTLDRCLITNQIGDMLTYTNLGTTQNATANYGYFIQNDLRTLDTLGEWYHNTSTGKFYMYFGAVDPSTKTVKVSTINNLIVDHGGHDYITVDNIALIGSISFVINFHWQNDYSFIQNCNISFAGSDGIRLFGVYGTIDNNQITNCFGNGIYTYGSDFKITNNTIKNISIIPGQSKGWLQLNGIFVESSKTLVQYNRIENIGYDGITIASAINNTKIQNNFINNTCLILNDGGGIYISGTHTGVVIDGNIIFNSIGSYVGTPNTTLMAEGIYLDEHANGITVSNNTIAHCKNGGIKLHKAHDDIITGNTSFDNLSQMHFENWEGNGVIYGHTLTWNIFFAKETTQYTLSFISTGSDISNFGTANNNYYVRPIDDNLTFRVWQSGYTYKTFAQWQSLTSQDANSHKSPIAVADTADIDFYYNETQVNKVIALAKPMIDVKGAKYRNSITLLPFTSAVLIVDPNPDQSDIPVYVSSAIQNATPSVLEMTYNLSLTNIAPAASAFSVKVNSVAVTVNSVAVSGTKVLFTLAVPVVYGDVVTVSYTQPSANPLQTTSAGKAESVSAQTVTNNVAPPSPIYVNSTIQNAAPAVLEMTYNLSLANITPAASAFSVQVNSVARTINTVAVPGTKVLLTLAVPVVYGDIVTVSYTQPSSNPLQTTSAGQAASVSAQVVTNNVNPSSPVYVSAAIQNAAPSMLEMTYNLSLANIAPAASAFSVQVNSVIRSVNTVAVSGTKVLLTLAVPVVYGDIITVLYTKPSVNPLQTVSAGLAESVSDKAVTNNCLKIPAKNDPPVIVIKNDTSSYSGSVGEIDASGSYDLNNDSLTYEWIVPDNISASATNSPIIQFLSPVVKTAQNFEFQLKVGDGKAVVTKSITIVILPDKLSVSEVVNCTLMIPNAFSPNGDGINDYFKVSCIENYPDAKLLIYSRTSALLYEKQHYGNLDFWGSEAETWWAGHICNSGNTLASGSYIYILDLDHGKKDLIKTGVVFISS